MARQRRPSGHPPEGSDPRDRWREHDDAEIPDDPEWTDDDVDPFDGRPLPRRRGRGSRLARALAWIGGAALLMVTGGLLALATWPGPEPTVVSGASDAGPAGAPVGAAPPEEAVTSEQEARGPRLETVDEAPGGDASGRSVAAAAPVERSTASSGSDGGVSPPPLPPLPPGLEVGAPAAATRPEAVSPPEVEPRPEVGPRGATYAPAPSPPAVSPPAPARKVTPTPAPVLSQDTRTSEEIMADFLVSSGDRAQAEATAGAYAEWYPAGSAERGYWLRVLGSIRARP